MKRNDELRRINEMKRNELKIIMDMIHELRGAYSSNCNAIEDVNGNLQINKQESS